MHPSITSNKGAGPIDAPTASSEQSVGVRPQSSESGKAGNTSAAASSSKGRVEPARAEKPSQLVLPENLHAATLSDAPVSLGSLSNRGPISLPMVEPHWQLPGMPDTSAAGASRQEGAAVGQEMDVATKLKFVADTSKKTETYISLMIRLTTGRARDGEKCADLSLKILPDIKKALDTYQELPRKEQKKKENQEHKKMLLEGQHRAAFLACDNSLCNQRFEETFNLLLGKTPEDKEDFRNKLTENGQYNQSRLEKLRDADRLLMNNVKSFHSICSDGKQLEHKAHLKVLEAQEDICRVQLVNMARLVDLYGDPAVSIAVEALRAYTNATAEAVLTARNLLLTGKGSVQEYNQLKSVAEGLVGHGEQFCMVAAARFQGQGDSVLWQACMNSAHAVADAASIFRQIAEECYVRTDSDWVTDLTKTATTAPDNKGKSAETSTGKKTRKSRGKSTAKAVSKPAAPAPKDEMAAHRREVIGKVNHQLKQWSAVPAGDDPIALARAMPDKDLSVIDALSGDPLSVAHQKRNQVDNWFGSSRQLNELRQALSALGDTPGTLEKLAELDQCLERRERMDRHLERDRTDSIKTYEFPKASHLMELLARGEIEPRGVSAPVKLQSSEDSGNRGRLFEIRIQPKPLSDGRPSPAVYLHLHTNKAVSKEDLPGLDAESFTAVHLKTQNQRGLGRRWEQLTGALGTVHRGRVEGELRQQILQMAAQGRHQ